MEDVKAKPVARCNHCGATSTDSIYVNMRCTRQLGGKRCSGTVESAVAPEDWRMCDACSGSGRQELTKCGQCRGEGWIFSRNAV